MMRGLILFLCLRIQLLLLFSQNAGSLTGVVYNSLHEPIEYAHVQLKGTGWGTIADSNGIFYISDIPPGHYKVHVSALGFQQAEKNVKIESEKETYLSVVLFEVPNTLAEVVVTGTMKEVAYTTSPIPVEILTPKLFQKNPTSNIFESLQIINGVQPQINCNVCGTGDIHINGMEGSYTMVTIDGMPIVSSLATVYGLMGIPNSLIQRVEIVKGPASTLYGSEAMAGVINIITKNPLDAPLFSADGYITSQGEMNLDVGVKTARKKAHSLFGLNGFWQGNRMDVNNDNFTDVPLQKRISVFNKWQFARKNQKQTSFAARWFYENRWGGEMQWSPVWRGTDSIYGEHVITDRAEFIARYELPGKEHIQIQISYNYHHQNSMYGTTSFIATQHLAFVQGWWSKHLGRRHDLLVGIPVRYQYYNDNTPATASIDYIRSLNQPLHTLLPGVFVQDEITLNEKWTVLTGVRYEYDFRHGSIFSPRLNGRFQLNRYNTIRCSAGNGYRIVNLFTEDHAALTGSRKVVIKSNLKPERSWNVNINYHRLIVAHRGFMNVNANAFYTFFTNKIVGDFLTDNDKIIYDNLKGHAVSRGISVNTDLSLTCGITLILGFTIADVYQHILDSAAISTKQPQIHNPLFSATFSCSYQWQKPKLLFDITGKIFSPMHLPVLEYDFRPATSPWFALMNIQLTKSFCRGLEVYAGLKNILNFIPLHPIMRPFDPFDKHVDDPDDNPFGYTFDTSYNYAPLQGIRGFLGIRYLLK